MPNRVPWIFRRFHFDSPVDLYPEYIERLRGTPARVEEAVIELPRDVLTRPQGDTWSIQENIGHLGDLESLFTGRLDDFEAGLPELRPADMTNQRTNDAGHNDCDIEDVLADFRSKRDQLIARLESMKPEDFDRVALHARLETTMRVIDMMLFHAEHDDYHLARIRQLIQWFA